MKRSCRVRWVRGLPGGAVYFCFAVMGAQAGQSLPDASDSNRVAVVESNEDLRESLLEKPLLRFGSARIPALTIEVNDSVRYQQIDGFGASLTDSSAWLISQKLSETQRAQLLAMLFDRKKGIGLVILRQPMGASDFALQSYTYDDLPPG